MDSALRKLVLESRKQYDADPNWLNTKYPIRPFDQRFRGAFVAGRLLRRLIEEAKARALKKGDAMDLSQAVIAAGFSSGGTLDKKWKRRVDQITGPHQLSPVHTSNQLAEFVAETERAVETLQGLRRPPPI
jgi:hypothetical protein